MQTIWWPLISPHAAATDSGENSDPRLMCTCKETACWGDTFRFLVFPYQIFDIQLDIRLIFGGGRLLAASILVGSMMGGNKRIIISAAVDRGRSLLWCKLTKYLSTILIPLYWWHCQCRVYYCLLPCWSLISSLRGWANTGSYCSWLIPSPCFLPPAHSFSIWCMLSTNTVESPECSAPELNHQMHQSVQTVHCWIAPNGAHQLATEQRIVNNGQM